MTNYLLAGGGTGGHVNPLLALAEYIRTNEPDGKVWALGTAEGLESRLVPERGFELITIARLPFPRKPSFYALKFPLAFSKAVKEIQAKIRELQIDVVVGFGGYASAPAYVAARRMRIPYVIHEANALPGMANKLGSKNASAVGVAFEGTPLPGATVVGMPLRKEIEAALKSVDVAAAREYFGLDPKLPTLLVTGGSLGARQINEQLVLAYPALDAAGIQVLHIIGGNSELDEIKSKGLTRIKYCDRMDLAISAANLAIARSGSSTVCEFGAFGLPTVFVPYPVGNGEQKFNAANLVGLEAAILVEDSSFDSAYIRDRVIPLISNTKRLSEMSLAAKSASIADGTSRLYRLVQGVLPKKGVSPQ